MSVNTTGVNRNFYKVLSVEEVHFSRDVPKIKINNNAAIWRQINCMQIYFILMDVWAIVILC